MLAIVWGYAIPNLGAIISESRRWRIVWTVLAILGNLGFLWFGGSLLFDLADPFSAVFCLTFLMLVLLNTLAILSRPFTPHIDG